MNIRQLLPCIFLLIQVQAIGGNFPFLDSLFEYNYRKFEKQYYSNLKNKLLGNEGENDYIFVFDDEYSEYQHIKIIKETGNTSVNESLLYLYSLDSALISFNKVDNTENIFKVELYFLIIKFNPLQWIDYLSKFRKSSKVLDEIKRRIEEEDEDKELLGEISREFELRMNILKDKIKNLINNNDLLGQKVYNSDRRVLISLNFWVELKKNQKTKEITPREQFWYLIDVSAENSSAYLTELISDYLNYYRYKYQSENTVDCINWLGYETINALQTTDYSVFWDKFNENTPEIELVNHLQTELAIQTSRVNVDKRQLALTKLLFGTESFNEEKEYAIIKILSVVRNDEIPGFLSIIETEEGGKGGLQYIWEKFDNHFLGRANLNSIILVLSSIINRSGVSMSEEEIIDYYDKKLKPLALEADLFSFQNFDYEILEGNKVRLSNQSTNENTPAIDYKSMVAVEVVKPFKFQGEQLTKGTIMVVPAIQAILYSRSNTMEVAEDAAWLALDIGTLVIGVGGLNAAIKAASWARKITSALDVIGSTAGIVIQSIPSDMIDQDLRSKIQLASFALSLPDIAVSLTRVGDCIDEMVGFSKRSNLAEADKVKFEASMADMAKSVLPKKGLNADFADEILDIADAGCDFLCKIGKYGCFPAGTSIVTESENIPIEDIKVDDKVLSFNHQTNRPEMKKVTSIKSYLVSAIMALVFSSGDTLWATPNHPFWFDGQYVEAESLNAGDTLWTIDGSALILENKFTRDTAVRVYNFTIEDNHNYYVGSPGVLVHNDCFFDKIKNSPGLVAAIDELPKGLKGEFIKDFAIESSKVLDKFKDNPHYVKSWERIFNAAKKAHPDIPDAGRLLRKDMPSIEALARFDDKLVTKIGTKKFDDFLTKLIEANPKCSSCKGLGSALVGNLDDIINDLYKVVTERVTLPNGQFVEGFAEFMIEAGEQASKAKGASLTLKKMSNNWDELTEVGYTLSRFEGNIPDIETGHKLDLLFERTNSYGVTELKAVEMKNWSSARTVPSDQGSQYYAYLKSGNKFEYYFNDEIRDAMKYQFQNIYTNSARATELFNLNPSYFTSQGISSATVLNNLAKKGDLVTHPTFMNFIK